MANDKAENRRRFPRLKEACEIRFRRVEGEGLAVPKAESLTRDISEGGVCFTVDQELPPGSLLAVELSIPDFKSDVVALGRSVWCDPVDAGRFEIGLEFWWVGWSDDSAQRAITDHIRDALTE